MIGEEGHAVPGPQPRGTVYDPDIRQRRRAIRPPGTMDHLLTKLESSVAEVRRQYSDHQDYAWEQVARQLRGRLQRQRGEIARLHAKVTALRAEAHEWREAAEAPARPVGPGSTGSVAEGPSTKTTGGDR